MICLILTGSFLLLLNITFAQDAQPADQGNADTTAQPADQGNTDATQPADQGTPDTTAQPADQGNADTTAQPLTRIRMPLAS